MLYSAAHGSIWKVYVVDKKHCLVEREKEIQRRKGLTPHFKNVVNFFEVQLNSKWENKKIYYFYQRKQNPTCSPMDSYILDH